MKTSQMHLVYKSQLLLSLMHRSIGQWTTLYTDFTSADGISARGSSWNHPSAIARQRQTLSYIQPNYVASYTTASVEPAHTVQGDRAPRGLSFVDSFAKCSAGRRFVTVAALLPAWKISTSYFDVNKTQVHEVLGHPVRRQLARNAVGAPLRIIY